MVLFPHRFHSLKDILQVEKEENQMTEKFEYRTKIILDTNQLLQNGKNIEEIGNTMAFQLNKCIQTHIGIGYCMVKQE